MNKIIRFLGLISLAVLLLNGCKPTTAEQQFKGMTSQQIYQGAEKALAKGKYDQAIKYFEGLQSVYPFAPEAQQAQLDIIYAYYKNGDYASAISAADRYIHLYPQSDQVPYAYYMKGLVNFDRGRSWMQRKFGVSSSEIDPTYLKQSYIDFNELVERFPDSKYAPDAQKRMTFARNMLAQNEIDVARFYLRQKAYVAAINRASTVVKHYQQSPQVVDALVILVKANRALGLTQQANEALKILQSNYPNSRQLRNL